MNWDEFLYIVGREPVFSSSVLLAGDVDPKGIAVQLSRWVESGRLIRLRRGVYAVAKPYRTVEPHPFVVAGHLRRNSYVSLQSALAFHGLIPEHVPVFTSVTPGRGESLETPLGGFVFRHVKKEFFFGYRETEVVAGQRAFVAEPEKALLDLVHLTPDAHREPYLRELRLQNTDEIRRDLLRRYAGIMDKPKMRNAASVIARIVKEGEGKG